MLGRLIAAALLLAVMACSPAADSRRSPHADDLDSPVRGLSRSEVDALLSGGGAGLARSAELNGHPGPLHLLELRDELELSADQVAQVQQARTGVERDARALGAAIVDRERALSEAFASRRITESDLRARLDELARLQADLRAVHLRAHLVVTPLLSEAQIARYGELRGYADGVAPRHPQRTH